MGQNPSGPRGPLYNGAVPQSRPHAIAPPVERLTGSVSLSPYANFGPQGHRRYGLRLKRPREPVPYRPPEWDA